MYQLIHVFLNNEISVCFKKQLFDFTPETKEPFVFRLFMSSEITSNVQHAKCLAVWGFLSKPFPINMERQVGFPTNDRFLYFSFLRDAIKGHFFRGFLIISQTYKAIKSWTFLPCRQSEPSLRLHSDIPLILADSLTNGRC